MYVSSSQVLSINKSWFENTQGIENTYLMSIYKEIWNEIKHLIDIYLTLNIIESLTFIKIKSLFLSRPINTLDLRRPAKQTISSMLPSLKPTREIFLSQKILEPLSRECLIRGSQWIMQEYNKIISIL